MSPASTCWPTLLSFTFTGHLTLPLLLSSFHLSVLCCVVAGSPNIAIPADALYAKFYEAAEPLPVWPEYSVHNNLTVNLRNYEVGKVTGKHFVVVPNIDRTECDLWDQAVLPDWYNVTTRQEHASVDVQRVAID